MRRAADMFPDSENKRRRSKANMHAIDAGPGVTGNTIAVMECRRMS